jgi:hypothetical protein
MTMGMAIAFVAVSFVCGFGWGYVSGWTDGRNRRP